MSDTKIALRRAGFAVLAVALTAGGLGAQWSTDALSVGRGQYAAVSADGKAYFAGGRDFTTLKREVDIYDGASGTWSEHDLLQERCGLAAAAVGDWVLFAGGATSLFGAAATPLIDVLDTQTGVWSTATLPTGRFNPAAVTLGSKVLIAGGSTGGPLQNTPSDVVDIYDSALGPPDDPAAWSKATLSVARSAIAGTVVGTRALFAGGVIGPGAGGPLGVDTVDVYDDSTGLWSTATLSQARLVGHDAATSSGTRAYFAGGQMGDSMSDVVDVYDAALGPPEDPDSWSTLTLSEPRTLVSAVALGDAVLFAGGLSSGGVSDVVDTLDAGTGSWRPTRQLSAPRADMASTTLGTWAFLAGGFEAGSVGSLAVDIDDSTWVDLGGGSSGLAGTPALSGAGSLVGGSSTTISLDGCPPGALLLAWISFAPTPFAAVGGTVHAYPFVSQLPLAADPSGALNGSTNWPPGLSPVTQVWFQILVQDATVVHGFTLSNGLRATTP